jgi:hypothetical protein
MALEPEAVVAFSKQLPGRAMETVERIVPVAFQDLCRWHFGGAAAALAVVGFVVLGTPWFIVAIASIGYLAALWTIRACVRRGTAGWITSVIAPVVAACAIETETRWALALYVADGYLVAGLLSILTGTIMGFSTFGCVTMWMGPDAPPEDAPDLLWWIPIGLACIPSTVVPFAFSVAPAPTSMWIGIDSVTVGALLFLTILYYMCLANARWQTRTGVVVCAIACTLLAGAIGGAEAVLMAVAEGMAPDETGRNQSAELWAVACCIIIMMTCAIAAGFRNHAHVHDERARSDEEGGRCTTNSDRDVNGGET